jgi:hypothetical protein
MQQEEAQVDKKQSPNYADIKKKSIRYLLTIMVRLEHYRYLYSYLRW